MDTSVLKNRLMKEIDLVPESYLIELYEIIHSFRTEKAFAEEKNDASYDDLDDLFGKWSEEEFRKIQGKIDSERKTDQELWK